MPILEGLPPDNRLPQFQVVAERQRRAKARQRNSIHLGQCTVTIGKQGGESEVIRLTGEATLQFSLDVDFDGVPQDKEVFLTMKDQVKLDFGATEKEKKVGRKLIV